MTDSAGIQYPCLSHDEIRRKARDFVGHPGQGRYRVPQKHQYGQVGWGSVLIKVANLEAGLCDDFRIYREQVSSCLSFSPGDAHPEKNHVEVGHAFDTICAHQPGAVYRVRSEIADPTPPLDCRSALWVSRKRRSLCPAPNRPGKELRPSKHYRNPIHRRDSGL